MYKRSFIVVFLFISGLLSGCAAQITPRYSLHAQNMVALQNVAKKSDVKLKVNKLSSNIVFDKETWCRGLKIMVPDDRTFTSFIRNALIDELMVSDMYSDTSIMEINGDMKNIELQAASISEGAWIIEMQMSIGMQQPFTLSIKRPFSTGFSGKTACENAKAAFVPTVQDFINLIITHPEFQSAVLSKSGIKQ